MDKFEYLVLPKDELIKASGDEQRGLNKLGDESWELIAIKFHTIGQDTYTFKRKKNNNQ